jgi:DNA-binding transcriptional MerR regulator
MTTTAVSARNERLLRIGAVCARLRDEFPDISISKIRYLEDQGLLTPQRTQGGYRLFGEDDVDRLRTILRLQREEFLPLRVIRQELSAPSGKNRRRKRASVLGEPEPEIDLDELCERAGVSRELVRELDEYDLLEPRNEGGEHVYPETDVEVAAACAKLHRFGISARHLRAFRTAAEREAALLEQLVAPALRGRSEERRSAGLEDLQALGEAAHELGQALLWRAVRSRAAR